MFNTKLILKKITHLLGLALVMGSLLVLYAVNEGALRAKAHDTLNSIAPEQEVKYLVYKAQYNQLVKDNQTAVTNVTSWSGVPVLLYHGIVKTPDRFSMSQETFKDQMFALKLNGYNTISVEEFNDFIYNGKTLPPKSFLLTFDDGRLDSYVGADPILRAVGFKATMFVAVDSSIPLSGANSTYYISADDIAQMIHSKRWEIGSHALQETGGYVPIDAKGDEGNFLSSLMWLKDAGRLETTDEYTTRVTREIVNSKQQLQDTFHVTIAAFAYPFGDFGLQSVNNSAAQETIEQLITANYPLAFRQVWRNDGNFHFNYTDTDHQQLRRIETPTDWTGEDLVSALTMAQDKTIPYVADFSTDEGWRTPWGDSSLLSNTLTVESTKDTTGASVFLDGTKSWTDYTYSVHVTTTRGSHISLLARFKNTSNYVDCNFGQGQVRIETTVNDVTTKTLEVKNDAAYAKSQSYGVSVKGDIVECRINNHVVARQKLTKDMPANGGIGFLVWDEKLDGALAIIDKLTVVSE